MKLPRSLAAISCLLLTVSCLSLGTAWRLQASAASRLEEAKAVQDRPVPEVDAKPPTPALNRKIIANLARATEIRTNIDGAIRRVGSSVERIGDRQKEAGRVARISDRRLRVLATTLLRAIGPARASNGALGRVVGRLKVSASLAAQIREELRKLDEKLGTPLP